MQKENLKPNEISAPTIFIGVGGIGSDIVMKVAEKCQDEETENLSFVCLDTNVNDLLAVKRSKANIYYVQTSNTQTVGDYLDYDEDARRNWFPKNSVMYDKTVSEGAGQVRAISRLAFDSTVKTGNIAPLLDAVDDLFRKSGADMKQALRVVFASSASGGTGSGMLLPLSMYIRDYVKDKYPNTSLITRGLILLPETLDSVIGSTQEKESQRRNAYATIKEINAFMMKGSGFFDIDEDLKRYKNLKIDYPLPGGGTKSLALLPMDFCFLMDGQDAEDVTMVNLNQYKEQAAQALYEQNIGPMQKNAFSLEDNIIKELTSPGNLGRNRFGGIGASVLRYPYEQLADYVAYSWALDNIGGENDAGKWGRYDKAYELQAAENKRRGIPATQSAGLGDVYMNTLKAGTDPFSIDVRTTYLDDDNGRVDRFLDNLASHVQDKVLENPEVESASMEAKKFSGGINYKGKEGNEKRGRAKRDLTILRRYEDALRTYAKTTAETEADAIFSNETKTVNTDLNYSIEGLLRNSLGEIAHPVAARYLLYKAKDEMQKQMNEAYDDMNEAENTLRKYSPTTTATDKSFDVKYTRKKEETTLDDLCEAEKEGDSKPNLVEKLGGYDKIYSQLNDHFSKYYRALEKYSTATPKYYAFKKGYTFICDALEVYEKFFSEFKENARDLEKKRDDIVEEIKFRKGDSVLNICSDQAVMDELVSSVSRMSAQGSMLSSDLNGAIYDAVKSNVAFNREMQLVDVMEDDKRVDIFNDIILGYFRDDVRNNCDSMNVNIVEAMALERRLKGRVAMRETQEDGKPLVDHITSSDTMQHIQELIDIGINLAAPSIQRIRNEEPREIKSVAYNTSLNAMRNYRMGELFGKGINAMSSDSISKYELHFFTAMYNVTPDKLTKFACPEVTETRDKNAGLYFKAYADYAKYLGPDSTKNMMISTHIDKRWDSISAMPEMDMNYQKKQMMRIHQALIYALLYEAIQERSLSDKAKEVGGKTVFSYENSDERIEDLTVSNGTLCDEFYEILDSLYIDASVVEDIGRICEKRHAQDKVRNADYEDTKFAKAVREFKLPFLHDEIASVFEIPLAYYNTLPSSQRYTGEISTLVDAVIRTFDTELLISEGMEESRFMLCDVLKDQFKLLIENYNTYDDLNYGKEASDNMVIDMIFRKIRQIFDDVDPDNAADILDGMKASITELSIQKE